MSISWILIISSTWNASHLNFLDIIESTTLSSMLWFHFYNRLLFCFIIYLSYLPGLYFFATKQIPWIGMIFQSIMHRQIIQKKTFHWTLPQCFCCKIKLPISKIKFKTLLSISCVSSMPTVFCISTSTFCYCGNYLYKKRCFLH